MPDALKVLVTPHRNLNEVMFFENSKTRVVHLFFRTYQDAQTWIIRNPDKNVRYLCRQWSQAHLDDLDFQLVEERGLTYARGVSKHYRPLPGRYT